MHSSTVTLTVVLRILKEFCLIDTDLRCLYECRNSLTKAGVPALSATVKVRTKCVTIHQPSCEVVQDAHA